MDKKMKTTMDYSGLWIWNCGFGVVVLQKDFPTFIQLFGCPSRSKLVQSSLAVRMAAPMAQQVVPELFFVLLNGIVQNYVCFLEVLILRITLYWGVYGVAPIWGNYHIQLQTGDRSTDFQVLLALPSPKPLWSHTQAPLKGQLCRQGFKRILEEGICTELMRTLSSESPLNSPKCSKL